MAHNDYAPWGARNRLSGAWTGCDGTERVSHEAALCLERTQPLLWKAERNPADVLADELDAATDAQIWARAEG